MLSLVSSSQGALLHDTYTSSILTPWQTGGKWVLDATTFGWDSATNTPRPNMATVTPSAMFMAGSMATTGYKGQSFSTLPGSSYTARVTWAPGFVVPMDEDVAFGFCNINPDNLGRRKLSGRRRGRGLGIGLALAFGITRVIGLLMYQVDPQDPGIFAGVVTLIVLVGMSAAVFPALRATGVDPVEALRSD